MPLPIPPLYAELIRRARDKATIFQRRVGGTGAMAAILEREATEVETPQAWIVPLTETATAPANLSESQKVHERFGVIVVVANTANRADGLGLIATDSLRVVRQELFNAFLPRLSEWAPEADRRWMGADHYIGCRYVGGRHLQMTQARLWHQYEFSLEYYIGYDVNEDPCYPVREAYLRLHPEGTPRPEGYTGFDLVHAGLNPLLRDSAEASDEESAP